MFLQGFLKITRNRAHRFCKDFAFKYYANRASSFYKDFLKTIRNREHRFCKDFAFAYHANRTNSFCEDFGDSFNFLKMRYTKRGWQARVSEIYKKLKIAQKTMQQKTPCFLNRAFFCCFQKQISSGRQSLKHVHF